MVRRGAIVMTALCLLKGGAGALGPSAAATLSLASVAGLEDTADPLVILHADDVQLIVVSERRPELLPVVTPLVAARARRGAKAFMVVSGDWRSESIEALMRHLSPTVRDIRDVRTEPVNIGEDRLAAAMAVAGRGWGLAQEAVAASVTTPGRVIMGAALAAHLGVPFVPVEADLPADRLARALERLGVRRLLVAVARDQDTPAWLDLLPLEVRTLDEQAISERLVRTLGPEQIHNVIVARAPGADDAGSELSLLAPYLSLARGAAVVLSDSAEAELVERQVRSFLSANRLRPRSITNLADRLAIGTRRVTIPASDEAGGPEYVVEVEPCAQPPDGLASAVGVGRIPWRDLAASSLMIVRGLAREYSLLDSHPRLLMIANPQNARSQLPLCETVSRATAKEFRNVGVKVDEFYRTPSDTPEIRRAAEKAALIIYEGHLGDQQLFAPPMTHVESEFMFVRNGLESLVESPGSTVTMCDVWPMPNDHADLSEGSFGDDIVDNGLPLDWTDRGIRPYAIGEDPKPAPRLRAAPVVVLQSCISQDPQVGRNILDAGGVAILGSNSNVHSASGSSFVKSVTDAALYRGATLGEALRDARNYFFCLYDLKRLRGHKQQAKCMRTALSFCLWGDPELRVFPQTLSSPVRDPLSIRWEGRETLVVSTPRRCLSEARTDRYVARIFPGSQLAGIVKRSKREPARRLMPMHFFPLPTPDGFHATEYVTIERPGDVRPRGVFRVDEMRRLLYVLYFPKKDRANESYTLEFRR